MRGPLDVHRVLLERGVEHEIVHLPMRLRTTTTSPTCWASRRTAASSSDSLPSTAAAAGRPAAMVAAVVPAHDWPDVRALADVLGAQPVRRASSAEVSAATDTPTTLVSPIALGSDLPLLVEASLREAGDAPHLPSARDLRRCLWANAANMGT